MAVLANSLTLDKNSFIQIKEAVCKLLSISGKNLNLCGTKEEQMILVEH